MLLNHRRELAAKNYGGESNCPDCERALLAKCGEIKTHHWAHKALAPDCNYQPKTEWHMQWQLRFPLDWLERRYRDGRADVLLPSGDAIEFQSKTLDPEIVATRAGGISPKHIAWIVDGREAFQQGRIDLRNHNNDHGFPRKWFVTFRWKQPHKWTFNENIKILLIDTGCGLLDVRKVYPGPPTGGWGYLRDTKDFIDYVMHYKSLEFITLNHCFFKIEVRPRTPEPWEKHE